MSAGLRRIGRAAIGRATLGRATLGRAAPLLAALWLAGCATPPPASHDTAAQTGLFERNGRFALRVDEAGGNQEAVQGNFIWRDSGTQLALDLTSPLGGTLARVDVTASGSRLTESNGRETLAATPDELVARVLGNPIPVAALRSWLRGELPAQPPANITERDADGRPQAYTQLGWQVRITGYDDQGPTRLQLSRSAAGGGTIHLRLVATP